MKNCTLKHISLEGSRVADEGLESVYISITKFVSIS